MAVGLERSTTWTAPAIAEATNARWEDESYVRCSAESVSQAVGVDGWGLLVMGVCVYVRSIWRVTSLAFGRVRDVHVFRNAFGSFRSTERGKLEALDNGSWLLVPRRCWAGLEPSLGRTLRASRLCLRLKGALGRAGRFPRGVKGVDSSPSRASAHPSRKTPPTMSRVPSPITPEKESYFS